MNSGEDVEKRNSSTLSVGKKVSAATTETSMKVP